MTTATGIAPCPVCEALHAGWAALHRKALWIRVNRLLAWALVASPPVQIYTGARLVQGLLVDAAVLLAHAGLSLWLFGKPAPDPRERGLLWLGIAPDGLGARGRFLMWPWRIVVATGAIAAAGLLSLLLGPLVWGLLWPLVWVLPALPVFALIHVAGATGYALNRWGVHNPAATGLAAFTVTAGFAVTGTWNLFR